MSENNRGTVQVIVVLVVVVLLCGGMYSCFKGGRRQDSTPAPRYDNLTPGEQRALEREVRQFNK